MNADEDFLNGAGFLNLVGAKQLATRLESYWHERGYIRVRFFPVPVDERFEKVGSYEIWQVRHNFLGTKPSEDYR